MLRTEMHTDIPMIHEEEEIHHAFLQVHQRIQQKISKLENNGDVLLKSLLQSIRKHINIIYLNLCKIFPLQFY